YTFSFSCSLPLLDIHSFPTRRSSDLFELRHVLTDCFHLAGDITAEPRVSWFAQPENQAIKPCVADHVCIQRVERSRPNFNQHLRSEEHTSELQSPCNLVCRLLLEKKK